jgi:CheY-like chemotaxis protein
VLVKYAISDTGIGIPADKLNKLFANFSQINSSDTRKYGGTGLGLSISKHLVELQGGTILVESTFGKGTTFSFMIKYPVGSTSRLQQRIAAEQNSDGTILNGLRILIADDNEYNRMVVDETLHLVAKLTYRPCSKRAGSSRGGEKNHYDLILMDVQMPVMNGTDATRKIRATMPSPKSNQIPIVALTASVLRADLDECFSSGMTAYVPKPFKTWQLINTIAEVTGRERLT